MPKKTKTDQRSKSKKKVKTAKPSAATEKQYIAVNEIDEELQAKSRLVWLIVGFLIIALVFFWFWTLRQNMKQQSTAENLQTLEQEINKTVAQIKNIFTDTKNLVNQASDAISQEAEIEKLKNEIISQIELNLDSANWPQHTSQLLKISLQSPAVWTKQENQESLILKSFNSASGTPKIFGQITISRQNNNSGLTLNEWFSQKNPEAANYLLSAESIFVSGQEAVKYLKQNIAAADIDYLLYAKNSKDVYKIAVSVQNGKDLYEPILEQIIKTIKFVK